MFWDKNTLDSVTLSDDGGRGSAVERGAGGSGVVVSWMTYQRMRERNNLLFRKPEGDRDPYWRDEAAPPPGAFPHSAPSWWLLVGDMNRMERDYLEPVYPPPSFARLLPGSDPAAECAEATGVDVEVVRAVLRYVFCEQP